MTELLEEMRGAGQRGRRDNTGGLHMDRDAQHVSITRWGEIKMLAAKLQPSWKLVQHRPAAVGRLEEWRYKGGWGLNRPG